MDTTITCHYYDQHKKVYIYKEFEVFCQNIIKSFKMPVKRINDIKLYVIFGSDLKIYIDNNKLYRDYILEDIDINDIYCELDAPNSQKYNIQENYTLVNKINNLEKNVNHLLEEIKKKKKKINDINERYILLEQNFKDYRRETEKKIEEMKLYISKKENNLKNTFNEKNNNDNILKGTRMIREENENYNYQIKNQDENLDDEIYKRKRKTPTPQNINKSNKNSQKRNEKNKNDIINSNENNSMNNNKNEIKKDIITIDKSEINNYKEKNNMYNDINNISTSNMHDHDNYSKMDTSKINSNNITNMSDYNNNMNISNININNSENYKKNNDSSNTFNNNITNNGNYYTKNDSSNMSNNNIMRNSENYKKNKEITKSNNNKKKSSKINESSEKLSCKFIINDQFIINKNEIQNKVPIKFVIKLNNNGEKEIPKNCDIIGDPKSNLFIMETMVNNGNIILPGQKIEVSLYIFFKNYAKIQNGINQLNIILRHKDIGRIGEVGQIKINIQDNLQESDKVIISQTNPDIRKKMDDFYLLKSYKGANDISSSINNK